MAFFNRQKITKTAQKFVSQGKLEYAIKEYEKILKHDESDVVLLNTIGDLNLSLKRTQTAISYFKKVAKKYIEDGFYSRGLAVYRKIVRADSQNLENAELLADLFIKEGVVSEAKKAYAEIGNKYLQTNNFNKAYSVFRKLGELTHDDPKIHLKLAELGLKLKKNESAHDCFVNAATICAKQGDFILGIEAAGNALQIDPYSMSALKILFKLSLENQDFEAITDALTTALIENPDNVDLKEMLGESYMLQGRLVDAYSLLSEIYQQDEEKYFLLFDLAESAIQMENPDLAIQAVSDIINVLLTRKESAKLIEVLQSVIQAVPEHIEALDILADVYYKISDNFNYVDSLDKLSDACMKHGNYKKTIAVVEKLLGLDVSNEKYQKYHKEAFENLFPDEEYIPPDSEEEEEHSEASTGVFNLDTAELTADSKTAGKSETDTSLEIDLLLSYGLKDKARAKLDERIARDPNNIESRKKLKSIYKEEGDVKRAADLCFEIVNILTLKGEHEKAASYFEEGKSLDPSRSDISIPTGLLKEDIHFPDELDTSSTGFDLLEIEESIDLTDDLSDILVGKDEVEEVESPPSVEPEQPSRQETPLPVDISDGIDKDFNLRLEETLKSLEDLGINPDDIGMGLDQPVSDILTESVSEEPSPATPGEDLGDAEHIIPDVDVVKDGLLESGEPEVQDEKISADAIHDAAVSDADVTGDSIPAQDDVVHIEDKSMVDASKLFDLKVVKESTPPPLVAGKVTKPAPESEPPAESFQPPESSPKPIVHPSGVDKELEANLHEIDFFVKLGFKDNAIEELKKLRQSYPDHPEILSRLTELGIEIEEVPDVAPGKKEPEPIVEIHKAETNESLFTGASGFEQKAELAEDVAPEDVNIDLFKTTLKEGDPSREEDRDASKIAPEDVNIDLFNYVSAEPQPDEIGRPKSSFEAKKNIPKIPVEEVKDRDYPAKVGKETEQADNIFADVEADEVLANPLLFGEEKTQRSRAEESLYIPDEEMEKSADAENAQPKNIVSMHNIFADIVEEANKVFASNIEEDETDFETLYNLGIAYKEMGLLDDAIGEFQKAFQLVKDDPSINHFIKACHILSLCFFEKGLYKSAVKWCERGIKCPGHEEHEYKALKYDMARAYEGLGEQKKALEILAEIYEVDVNYRDVTSKIDELRKKIG